MVYKGITVVTLIRYFSKKENKDTDVTSGKISKSKVKGLIKKRNAFTHCLRLIWPLVQLCSRLLISPRM